MSQTATERWLSEHDGDLERLARAYALHVGYHATLPLAVLNYRQAPTTGSLDPIICECRGLVVEVNSVGQPLFVRIAARGFQRFHNAELQTALERFDFDHDFAAQTKEDGTYVLMFYYGTQWMFSTRWNFCEDSLPYNFDVTYDALLRETLGIGSAHNAILCRGTTYILELCSLGNRVIQRYEAPVVFLLGTVTEGGVEVFNSAALDAEAAELVRGGLPLARPVTYNCQSFDDAVALLHSLEHSDIDALTSAAATQQQTEELGFREGLVLVDTRGCRLKLKSQRYRLLHHFKFRGWQTCTARRMLSMVMGGDTTWIKRALFVADIHARIIILQRIDEAERVVTDACNYIWEQYLQQSNSSAHRFTSILFKLLRLPASDNRGRVSSSGDDALSYLV